MTPLELAEMAKRQGVKIIPTSSREQWLALRFNDVTASVAGALLGVHPYVTAFGLHLEKTGHTTTVVESDPVITDDRIIFPPAARGNSFEPVVVEHIKLLRPDWQIDYPLNRYWTWPEHRIGATPDALAIDPKRLGFGVIQIKTTSDFLFNKTWIDSDTDEIEIPLWIALQALVEAKMTGASWTAVAIMMAGLRTETVLIDIPIHDQLWTRLNAEIANFWDRIESGMLPDPDFARDGKLIAAMPRDTNEVVDIEGDKADRISFLLNDRMQFKKREEDGTMAVKSRKLIDNEVMHLMGNAGAVKLPDGRIVSAPVTNRTTLDADFIRKEMGEAWAEQRSKRSSFRQVKIKNTQNV